MEKTAPTKNKTTKKTTKNKKKIIIISTIVSLIVAIGGCLLGLAIWREETKPVLIDELTFEINSEIANSSLLLDGYEIVDEENIKTDELGKHEYTIKYRKSGREKGLTFSYSIVDTTAPEITANDVIEITEGEEIDIKSKIKISDNSKEEIQPEIEGEYDINKVGEYQLKAKVKDSSNNESEKEFKLIVKEKPVEQVSTQAASNKTYSNTNRSYSGSSSQSYSYDEPAQCKQFALGQVVDAYYYNACKSIGIQQCNFYWAAEQVSEYSKYWAIRYNNGKCDSISSTFEAQSPKPSMDAWAPGAATGHRTLYKVVMSW